jgi:hypothetical protein
MTMAKQPEKTNLVSVLDEMFLSLKSEASGANPNVESEVGDNPPGWPNEGRTAREPDEIGFQDRLRLFEAGLKWAGVRDKVAGEDDNDDFGKLRERFSRRTGSGSSRAAKAASGAANGAAGATPAPDHTTD